MLKELDSKICKKCGLEKPFNSDYFYRSNEKKYGLAYTCKECKNKTEKQRVKNFRDPKYKIQKYKYIDRKRGMGSDLSIKFMENSLSSICTYCGFPSTGLDRLNNSLGHTEKNCIPCCKECNLARGNHFSHEEMIILGKTIHQIKSAR